MKIKTFYSYFRSSTAYRLRIALNLKGIQPQEMRYINLRTGEQRAAEYLTVNPMGAVPAFVLEDGSVLTQSLAMLEWLEENFPKPSILAEDSMIKSRIRAFAQVIGCDIHPVNNLRILQYLGKDFGADEAAKKEWIQHWVHAAFPVLEQMAVTANTRFAVTEYPSIADICLVPQWYNAERFGVELAAYPKLAGVVAASRSLPAFIQAEPEKQADCQL